MDTYGLRKQQEENNDVKTEGMISERNHNQVITFASASGEAENPLSARLTSSSEHSEHTKCSSSFASSMVTPTHAG